MSTQELIPNLFKTEFGKIVSVIVKQFGLDHLGSAEDIVSETFLSAAETWGTKGIPENPTAWLYTVAKNKSKDLLKRKKNWNDKISINYTSVYEDQNDNTKELDLSEKNIKDSQLQMMFALCDECIAPPAQIGLALRILCGFGIEEISTAFLTTKETINKRLFRAKQKLKENQVSIELPPKDKISERLDQVLRTIYLLFNEGYYASIKNSKIRKDLCVEAMRLCINLTNYQDTNLPKTNALLALMCFHSSRFEARQNPEGEIVLYEDQNKSLWDDGLIAQGENFLNKAATGKGLSKYHLEAAIAYWHCQKDDDSKKWAQILHYYNLLLVIEYSPIAALNRTYALFKTGETDKARQEAKKLNLKTNHLYYALLSKMYETEDKNIAIEYLNQACKFAKSDSEQIHIQKSIERLSV